MSAAPGRAPIQSRAMDHDAEALGFQRLERVRAQRRARRRYRFLVVTALAIALAGAGILGFATLRRTPFERLGFPSSPAPVEMVNPAAAWPAATGSVLAPPAVAPRSIRGHAANHDATPPLPIQPEVDQRARPLSDRQGRGEVAPSRNERRDAEAVDPAAAIDWLLKTPRTRNADGREERVQ